MFIYPEGYLKNSGFIDPLETLIAVSITKGSSGCAGIVWLGLLIIDKIMKTKEKIKTPVKVGVLIKDLILQLLFWDKNFRRFNE